VAATAAVPYRRASLHRAGSATAVEEDGDLDARFADAARSRVDVAGPSGLPGEGAAVSTPGGRRFGRFRLVRPLSRDAISTTWLATAAAGGSRGGREPSQFAVRVVEAPTIPGDPHGEELVWHFLADVSRAGALDHPAIVRPVDSGVIDGHPFVATPLVRAVPLREMLAHDGVITQTAALAIFAQIAAALDVAHRAGITHGAISPRTLWVGPGSGRGVAYVGYVTGFGTDVLLREHLARHPRGEPLDDVLYVAPEQLRGESATPASDQYALACALFHTLASAPPFERETRSKLYGAHLMAAPPELTDRDPSAPSSVADALRRGLSKQPGERFATCGALVNAALPTRQPPPDGGRRRAAGTAGAAGAGAGQRGAARRRNGRPPAPAAGRARYAAARRPPWQLAVAAGGVVLAGAALWTLLRSSSGSSTAAAGEAAAGGATRSSAAGQAAGDPSETTALRSSEASVVEPGWSAKVADAAIWTLDATGSTIVAADRSGGVAGVAPGGGRVRWRLEPDGDATGPTDATEAADGGVGGTMASAGGAVVAGGAQLTAYDARSGQRRWTVDGPTRSLSILDDIVIGVADGLDGPEVLAVSLRDGSEVWHLHGRSEVADGPLTVASDRDRAYALHGQTLMAIDPAAASGTATGRQQVAAPTWQAELDGARPLLVQTAAGVVVAHDDGQVCGHAAANGVMRWCEPVPGAEAATPRLFAVAGGVVVATPEAVVALDRRTGAPRWSVSPGATGALVTAGNRAVVLADGQGQVSVLDPRDGDELLAIDDAGEVTAVATHNRRVVLATADGALRAFTPPSDG
jgi:outer membrane protein assembly factor BamB